MLAEPTPLASARSAVSVLPGSALVADALGAEDYAAVMRSRERAKSAHFSLHWRLSPAPVSRFGMVVAKRLTRTAIRRNLIKRQARALFALAIAGEQRGAAGAAGSTTGAGVPVARDVVLRLTRNPNELARAEQYAELQGLFAALTPAALAPRAGPAA